MKKKSIISIIVLVVLITGLISYNKYFEKVIPSTFVSGAYRDGVSLMPLNLDATGFLTNSSFEILFEEGKAIDLEEVKTTFKSEPEMTYTFESTDRGILVKAEESFEEGSIYKFFLGDISWAYISESAFELKGTLPRHQSNNVPIDTGIEFYFTHSGANVEDYFSIEPKVKGSFETYGNTVVFIPKALEAQTLYTITLEPGLSLKGSSKSIDETTTFSFETSYDESGRQDEIPGYASYNHWLYEFGTAETISIPFSFNSYQEDYDKTIESTIYQCDDIHEAVERLEAYSKTPKWTYYNNDDQHMDTKGLKKVLAFEHTVDNREEQTHNMNLETTLEEGYYIVESQWDEVTFTTMFQVTDMSYYLVEDEEEQVLWLHDLQTKQAVPSQAIQVVGLSHDVKSQVDSDGVVLIDKEALPRDEMVYYSVGSGSQEVLVADYIRTGYDQGSANYYRYLRMDKSLYQPDDTIHFFGFMQSRDSKDAPSKVTVTLESPRWHYFSYYPWMDNNVPLASMEVEVKDGFYDGNLELPAIEQGYYELNVSYDGQVISRHSVEVEAYVKPDYKLELTTDKEAIFIDDSVSVATKASFFEGTPVSDLPIFINVYGMDYKEYEKTANALGLASIEYTPVASTGSQGIAYTTFASRAMLPESGEIYGEKSIRVFINDIDVSTEVTLEDEVGTIETTIHNIILDRINDGSAEDDRDYLDDLVVGRDIQVTIKRNEWIKEESGEYYDRINKVVKKHYNYYTDTKVLETYSGVTDEMGTMLLTVDLPKEESVYYTVDLDLKDNDNRAMHFEHYFSDNAWRYPSEEDREAVVLDKTSYKPGESIDMHIAKGDEPLDGQGFMFLVASNGIKERFYPTTNTASTKMDMALMPNATVIGVAFDGSKYIEAEDAYLQGDYSDKEIFLEMNLDKENYMPGEEVELMVKAYQMIGDRKMPVSGQINFSVVDEAIFALRDQGLNTLAELYSHVGDGLLIRKGSHSKYPSYGWYASRTDGSMNFAMAGGKTAMSKMETKSDMVVEMAMDESASSADGGVNIRTIFKDTAYFATTTLDDDGQGTVTITLPDNITSWRISAAVLNTDLGAGSQVEEVIVSLPFFINPGVNTTYLVGDKPMVGVSAYGSELLEDEIISYTLRCEALGYEVLVTGRPYEKAYLPLWQLEEGVYDLEIIAQTESGLTDGYVETIEVVETYQEMTISKTYDALVGEKYTSRHDKMTAITFVDESVARFINDLNHMAYSKGNRVDQKLAAKVAADMLMNHFGLESSEVAVNLNEYILESGGIALLPYSDADLKTTVDVLPLLEDGNNKNRVYAYLFSQLGKGDVTQQSKILYGLITLGEPMLLELNQLSQVENLSFEDYIYVALSYELLGDTYMANKIYTDEIGPYMKAFDDVARIEYGQTEQDYIKWTSMALPLLSKLQIKDLDNAYAYVASNYHEDYLTSVDELVVIQDAINSSDVDVSDRRLTYSYLDSTYEVDFESYYGKTITIPSRHMPTFEILETSEAMALVLTYDGLELAGISKDSNISVTRHYENYKTGVSTTNFNTGDIVKVVIDWEIDKTAIDKYYQVIDFLPSGLVPMKNTNHLGGRDGFYYQEIEGQKVTASVYKDMKNYEPVVYFARVVTPGVYTANGTMIQGSQVKDSLNISSADIIQINE